MDELELLKTWPRWANANAETVLASPAWRMPVAWKGETAALVCRGEPVEDALTIRVAFDDEEHVLALGDSSAFPDLHLLWARRDALPSEVLLALVEKECGCVFQMLEGATKRLFAVRGLAETPSGGLRAFRLEANAETVEFALDLSPSLTLVFGDVAHLDLSHPSIRELTRSAVPEYATFDLGADERAALASGDFLLLPDGDVEGWWRWEKSADEAVRVCGVEARELTFAQIADGDLPPVPPLTDVELLYGGRPIARAAHDRVASAPALRVVEVGPR